MFYEMLTSNSHMLTHTRTHVHTHTIAGSLQESFPWEYKDDDSDSNSEMKGMLTHWVQKDVQRLQRGDMQLSDCWLE